MLTRWTSHLKGNNEKEEAFKNQIYSAKQVLERLRAIVDEDEKALDRSEITGDAYANANWSHHQAHKNGVRQYIAQIKAILNLDPQRN